MKITLKYHKKRDKNSKYQPFMFIDTGYPVRIQVWRQVKSRSATATCPAHEIWVHFEEAERWRGAS